MPTGYAVAPAMGASAGAGSAAEERGAGPFHPPLLLLGSEMERFWNKGRGEAAWRA